MIKPEENMVDVVNLEQKFSLFQECWQPKIVGELNGQYVKLARLKGEFIWHKHDDEDELFLVVKGQLRMKLEDKELVLNQGEMCVIPKGVLHLPIADEEVQIMMFEPKSTVNTGAQGGERTVDAAWI